MEIPSASVRARVCVQCSHPPSLSCLLLSPNSPLRTPVLFSAFPAQRAEERRAPLGTWHAWGWERGKERVWEEE